jgi:hypothetical protein
MAVAMSVARTAAANPQLSLPNAVTPPTWIQWLGWSDDGHRIAWREGTADQKLAPGQPVEIARLDARGAIDDRLQVVARIGWSLARRGIRVRSVARSERVAPADVLLKTARGRLLAVVVRGEPPEIAVLRKTGATYSAVARMPVRGPALPLDASGFPDDAEQCIAIVAHTGKGPSRQGTLIVVPLSQPAAAPPLSPTPTEDP